MCMRCAMIYGASALLHDGQKQDRPYLGAAAVRDYLEEIG